jgi:hypothetical protein
MTVFSVANSVLNFSDFVSLHVAIAIFSPGGVDVEYECKMVEYECKLEF